MRFSHGGDGTPVGHTTVWRPVPLNPETDPVNRGDQYSPDPSPRVMCRNHATDGQDCREQAVLVVWRSHEDQETEFPPCNLNPQTVRRCRDFESEQSSPNAPGVAATRLSFDPTAALAMLEKDP
jgi:hypothetical protein